MSWNLPPGCTDADIDRAMGGPDSSAASQDVETILEKAGFRRVFIRDILTCIADEEAQMEEDRRYDAAEARYDAWKDGDL